jgi:NADH-quinone oxidoreductase subunit E
MAVKSKETLDFAKLDDLLQTFPEAGEDKLIPILQGIQNAYGYLPESILTELNRRTGIPLSKLYGVATFYEQFYLVPHGKHTIKCCRGTACHVRGAARIAEAVEESLGVGDGQTTEDMEFTFETAACLGTCALAPVMMIDGTYHGKMTASNAKKIINELKSSGQEAS